MRLIIDSASDAYHNMAVDEAIAKTGKYPTLRLYQWSPPAISLGYFQSFQQEVDTQKCRKLGVDIVRRITGGGAVFHDKELTYSFIVPEEELPEKIIDSYHRICNGVVLGLKEIGIDAEFAPINDIITGGKKISGNAQTRRYGQVLQHGTILMDVDVDKMFSMLLVPDEKMKGKLINDVKQRVTSVNMILGRQVDFDEIAQAMVKGFSEEFNWEFDKGVLTEEEQKSSAELKEKFMSDKWTNKR